MIVIGSVEGNVVPILEWPYLAEDNGPPLAHRLSPERIFALSAAADLPALRRIELSPTDLCICDVSSAAAQVNLWTRLMQLLGVPPADFSPDCTSSTGMQAVSIEFETTCPNTLAWANAPCPAGWLDAQPTATGTCPVT